jgi:hypothetical protein
MTVPQQRSQQQPWPSTVAQQQQQRPAGPPPVQQRPAHAAPAPAEQSAGGSNAMTVLRATTYVLTSIASLLFILLVIYGAVKVNQLSNALSSSPFGSGFSNSSYETSPNAGTRPAICDTDPTNAVCYGG